MYKSHVLFCSIRRIVPLLIGPLPCDMHLREQTEQQQSRGVCYTPIVRFDLKQYEMEKRRRRELERAGIDVDADDDAPWTALEEKRRGDAEEERRAAEKTECVRAMLERRAEEDAERRKKFREFRARQLAMSRRLKEERASAKRHEKKNQRIVEEVVDDGEPSGQADNQK